MANISDDPTYDSNEQESLSNLRNALEAFFDQERFNGWIVDQKFEDMPATNIGDYLKQLMRDQSISFKDPELTEIAIEEPILFQNVCDYVNITDVNPYKGAKVYVLESGDFATVIIPIDLGEKRTNLFIQPLEDLKGDGLLILNLWGEIRFGKKKINLNSIQGIMKGSDLKKR